MIFICFFNDFYMLKFFLLICIDVSQKLSGRLIFWYKIELGRLIGSKKVEVSRE